MAVRKYRLLQERLGHPAGTVCYDFHGATYGCVSDDERATGAEHTAVTLDPSGEGYPFFTVPVTQLQRMDNL